MGYEVGRERNTSGEFSGQRTTGAAAAAAVAETTGANTAAAFAGGIF